MKTLTAVLVLCLSSPVWAQVDQVPIADVRVVGGSPDVRAWPVTAGVTSVEFTPYNFYLHFTREDGLARWPDVHIPGWGDGGTDKGTIQFTLWAVVNVNGQWLTTGGIEFWYGRVWNGVGGPFSKAAQDWYYHAGEMTGHQPNAGDLVGFFVTAGDARRKDVTLITERSNIVLVRVPPSDTGKFEFNVDAPPPVIPPLPPPPPQSAPPPPVVVPPAPAPSPAPQPPAIDACGPAIALLHAQLTTELAAVNQNVTEGRAENRSFFESVRGEWKRILTYGAPIIGALFAGRATK